MPEHDLLRAVLEDATHLLSSPHSLHRQEAWDWLTNLDDVTWFSLRHVADNLHLDAGAIAAKVLRRCPIRPVATAKRYNLTKRRAA